MFPSAVGSHTDEVIKTDGISVIASFRPDGKIMPLYFRYILDSGEQVTYKILKVKELGSPFANVLINRYECTFEHWGYMKTIRLEYAYREHYWRIAKADD